MIDYNLSLKYLKELTSKITYITGLAHVERIDEMYSFADIRDKVVCKVDLLEVLYKHMSEDLVKSNRAGILALLQGRFTDAKTLSEIICYMCSQSEEFVETLNNMFMEADGGAIFGKYICHKLASIVLDEYTRYSEAIKNQGCRPICESDGYMYFSVIDKNITYTAYSSADWEVLSRAKSWRGLFNKVQ